MIFIPQNNDVIRCHGIATDARVPTQRILVLGPFNHTVSQTYAFLVEARQVSSIVVKREGF